MEAEKITLPPYYFLQKDVWTDYQIEGQTDGEHFELRNSFAVE